MPVVTRLREKLAQILLIPTMLQGAAHTSHHTVSIVTAQTSCHVAVDESNRNQLASLTTANQWSFAYLEVNCESANQHANFSFNLLTEFFFFKLFPSVICNEVVRGLDVHLDHFFFFLFQLQLNQTVTSNCSDQ